MYKILQMSGTLILRYLKIPFLNFLLNVWDSESTIRSSPILNFGYMLCLFGHGIFSELHIVVMTADPDIDVSSSFTNLRSFVLTRNVIYNFYPFEILLGGFGT